MLNKITFIILTKDRIIFLKNFFKKNKFLLNSQNIFLIIDGSNFSDHKKIRNHFKKYKRIKVIKQSSVGFMNACFESIQYIKTNYFSYLYDDDFFSKHIIDIHKNATRGNFSLGTGIVSSNQNISFEKSSFLKFSTEETIGAYYGNKIKNIKFLPVSPICSIFKKSILKNWKRSLTRFCYTNKLRKYFMLERNIGPDLLLYLQSINNVKMVYVYQKPIAVFYSHLSSMSIIFGKNELMIGYWLSKILFLTNNRLDNKTNNQMFSFLLIVGIYLLIKNFFLFIFFQKSYVKFIFNETKKINSIKKRKIIISYIIKIIFNKFYNLFV